MVGLSAVRLYIKYHSCFQYSHQHLVWRRFMRCNRILTSGLRGLHNKEATCRWSQLEMRLPLRKPDSEWKPLIRLERLLGVTGRPCQLSQWDEWERKCVCTVYMCVWAYTRNAGNRARFLVMHTTGLWTLDLHVHTPLQQAHDVCKKSSRTVFSPSLFSRLLLFTSPCSSLERPQPLPFTLSHVHTLPALLLFFALIDVAHVSVWLSAMCCGCRPRGCKLDWLEEYFSRSQSGACAGFL